MLPGKYKDSVKFEQKSFFRKHSKSFVLAPFLVVIVAAALIISGNEVSKDLLVYFHVGMDTAVELRFADSDTYNAGELKEEVFAEIDRLEGLFSRTVEDSEVRAVSEHAGIRPVGVSPEVLHVSQKALDYAELTGGAFDPTIAPLIDLWGFLGQEYRVPAPDEIEKTLPLADYTLVELDLEHSTVYLSVEGMAMDLGGIAKGFIVDRAVEMLAAAGVEHAFINAGGDIRTLGSKPDGEPWRIGVGHPREPGAIIAAFPLPDQAVVTSGDYQRAFKADGEKYHHILDPETGMPARELASVTIVAPTALEADALSTAVFVLGPEKGMALIEELEGVEGILVTPLLEVILSSGLEEIVELQSD